MSTNSAELFDLSIDEMVEQEKGVLDEAAVEVSAAPEGVAAEPAVEAVAEGVEAEVDPFEAFRAYQPQPFQPPPLPPAQEASTAAGDAPEGDEPVFLDNPDGFIKWSIDQAASRAVKPILDRENAREAAAREADQRATQSRALLSHVSADGEAYAAGPGRGYPERLGSYVATQRAELSTNPAVAALAQKAGLRVGDYVDRTLTVQLSNMATTALEQGLSPASFIDSMIRGQARVPAPTTATVAAQPAVAPAPALAPLETVASAPSISSPSYDVGPIEDLSETQLDRLAEETWNQLQG